MFSSARRKESQQKTQIKGNPLLQGTAALRTAATVFALRAKSVFIKRERKP